ncbi:hypothetical protein B0H13DRAFT_1976670 [Mycena leptocephala]|nr:hypothetical protein B0H13DRAFT_1976670 [Mycena leptocephala]
MFALLSVLILALQSGASVGDPCAAIAGQKWVSPSEARSCMFSFPVDEEIKANVLQVVNKTLPFHTSVNYQVGQLLFLNALLTQTSYPSDFDFHLDLYHSFRRLNDGHCSLFNLCYDSFYISYLPTPLVLLTAPDGSQNVHIAPEAFTIASAEFPDQIEFWQDSLPGNLKGKLASLSGAKVLQINGKDPFIAVNQNAEVTGGYQGFGTRQNSYFSSYSRGAKSWGYIMGNFAQQIHPLNDLVELRIQRINSSLIEQVYIPYRCRLGSAAKNFTDGESYRANNCVNIIGTNGFNLYDVPSVFEQAQQTVLPVTRQDRRRPVNVELQPTTVALNESYSVAQFYLLNDNITGVLALGSFSAANFSAFMGSLLDGLQELKSLGATRLIVDVVGASSYIYFKQWLHRILIGPKNTTEPQAGLDTCTRAGSLAQLIVEKINTGADPEELLSYHPTQWKNSSGFPFPVESHWLRPTVNLTINGHKDAFSPRLGQECQPFEIAPPDDGLFNPENIVIISNGRCGSSCSLFSITMSKHEGVKTVVVGGHNDVPQQYCGVVGGQSTHFAEIDTEIKSTYLKNHTLAPPDFVLGITWRLGFGLDNPKEPEEWQDHPADFNLPLTMSMQPTKIWEYTAGVVFPSTDVVTEPPGDVQAHLPYMDAGV